MRVFATVLIIKFAIVFVSAQQLVNKHIPFLNGTDTLKYATAGGLNLPQFSEIDLNNDGIQDLLVYDRSANVVTTFLNDGISGQNSYRYAPEYEQRFPRNVRNFMLARDFDCDGIKDLFHFNQPPFTAGGIGVQKGSYDANNKIQFTEVSPILKYNSSFGLNDIFIFNPDLPGIEDIDGDGDIDIAAFSLDFTFNRNIWFYRNLSAENGFGCDSLIFTLEHQCFGMASETPFNNNTYYLSPGVDSCADNPYWRPAATPRHTGSSVTLVDWNNDAAMDLLVGDVSYNKLNMLTAAIENDTIIFVSQDSAYPSYNQRVNLFSFPSAFFIDLNNDGLKDMIAAPTEMTLGEAVTDTVAWYYENTDNDSIILNLVKKDFLVGEMIDLGRASNAAIADVNGDGLLDIVCGHFAYTRSFQSYRTSLAYFQNIGTATSPAFSLVDNNFGGFSSLNERGLYPNFGDIDGDADLDLIIGSADGSLKLVTNTAGAGNAMSWGPVQLNYKGINVGDFSTPQFVDIDRDNDLDLMVGNYIGQLSYFENTGSANGASFSATPTNNTFGFDLNNLGSGYAAPFFYDNNGDYELFLGHELGGIIHLGNIDGNITGIYDTLSLEFENLFNGKFSTIAIADFDGNDTLDYLLGNVRGGFNLYSYQSQDTLISSDEIASSIGNAIEIFPNPFSSNINITFNFDVPNAQIRIFDRLGRLVFQKEFDRPDKFLSLDLNTLDSGFYIVEVHTQHTRQINKLLKK
jgi:hypothetical protein